MKQTLFLSTTFIIGEPNDIGILKRKSFRWILQDGRDSRGIKGALIPKDVQICPRIDRRLLQERNIALPQPHILELHIHEHGHELLHRRRLRRIRRRHDTEIQHALLRPRRRHAPQPLLGQELEVDDALAGGPLDVADDGAAARRLADDGAAEDLGEAEGLAAGEDGGLVVEDEHEAVVVLFASVRHLDVVHELVVAAHRAHAVPHEERRDERLRLELEHVRDQVLHAGVRDAVRDGGDRDVGEFVRRGGVGRGEDGDGGGVAGEGEGSAGHFLFFSFFGRVRVW